MNKKAFLLPLLLLVLVLMSFTSTMADDIGGGGSSAVSPATPVPSAPTYLPLTLTFSPNPVGIAAGTSKTVKLTIKNGSGSSASFVVTGCTLEITWSTGVKVPGSCSISSITIAAGKSVTINWTWTVGSLSPHGESFWNVIVYGTVKDVSYQSRPFAQEIIVT